MSFQNCTIEGIGINSSEYHNQEAKRGSPDFVMSPSSLKLFLECPARWIAGYKPPESEAKAWGNLLDCLLLTPKQFDSRYTVKPETYKDAKTGDEKPWNGNSNICKEWLSKVADGVCVVTKKNVFEAQAAVSRLMRDETIASFISASDTQVQITGEWHDESTGLVIPVQCLIDCVPRLGTEWFRNLGDLKTTRNAGQRAFSRWCFTASYHVQAAMDLDLFNATIAKNELEEKGRNDWLFIIQENYEPYETGRRLLSQDFVQIGRQTYQHALKMYARALKTGEWKGYDNLEEFSIIEPEPFMEFSAMEDAMERSYESGLADSETNDVPMP
jgi:PDDEXK-like domain of unknown function (DUF3799)